jgi:hypothetical protein
MIARGVFVKGYRMANYAAGSIRVSDQNGSISVIQIFNTVRTVNGSVQYVNKCSVRCDCGRHFDITQAQFRNVFSCSSASCRSKRNKKQHGGSPRGVR